MLPPILVHRSTLRVVDGMHRIAVAQLKGEDHIAVEFFDGDDQEAFILSVQRNVAHGLPLSLADRKAAAARILDWRQDLSDRGIATMTGLSDKTVAALRNRSAPDFPKSNARIGIDGRSRPVNAAEGRQRAARYFQEHPDASIREIARVSGISLSTAHHVVKLIRHGRDRPQQSQRPATATDFSTQMMLTRAKEAMGMPGEAQAFSGDGSYDSRAILEKLIRDPSLRTERGREALRWLNANTISNSEWPSFVAAIPSRWAAAVASLAQLNAITWLAFAEEIVKARPECRSTYVTEDSGAMRPDLPSRAASGTISVNEEVVAVADDRISRSAPGYEVAQ